MSNYLKKLRLKWIRTKPKKRTLGSYRHEHIRDFLIDYAKYLKDPNVVLIYTDESYIHSTHGTTLSYLLPGKRCINKGTRPVLFLVPRPVRVLARPRTLHLGLSLALCPERVPVLHRAAHRASHRAAHRASLHRRRLVARQAALPAPPRISLSPTIHG
jgi:hypothetical protein